MEKVELSGQLWGVNIIIRYTLRLLSAQQFERATKLILACEFIRKNHNDLGNERISIGFWVGDSTIPNKIKDAKNKYDAITNKLNNGNYANKSDYLNNPFQLSNCQWCNTKIIGREQPDGNPSIGHRISRNSLVSYCLNERCFFQKTMMDCQLYWWMKIFTKSSHRIVCDCR